MAAIATKKLLGDMGVAATFPYNFQQLFKGGISYYPSGGGAPMDIMVGTDFQSQYHEQKRLDANQSVMNGIQAKRTAERKLLTGPHNYHLPKPVLGQRRYANPSMGAEAYSSTRRDNGSEAPFRVVESGMVGSGGLVGGVVHTVEGQMFYKKQLQDRINQLNRLDAVAEGYSVRMGQDVSTADNTKEGSTDKVTFFLYLRTLGNAITEGDISKFSFENLKDLMKMLFNFAPYASNEDFKDIRMALDEIVESLRDGLSEEPSAALPITQRSYGDTLLLFTENMSSYCDVMFRNINLAVPEKLTLSKSLLKKLGFTSLMKNSSPLEVVSKERKYNARLNQKVDNYDDGPNDGEFEAPRTGREDEEQSNAPRAPFAGENGDPNRNIFGATTGIASRGTSSWFGEDVQDETAAFVSPLGSSGPVALAPPPDPASYKSAVEDAITHSLETVSDTPVTPDNVDELIEANYPDKNVLVAEIDSSLIEMGFTKAQIAYGMELYGNPIFTEYISANTGDIGPALAEPSYRASTAPSLPPTFWQPSTGSMAEGGPGAPPAPKKFQFTKKVILVPKGGFPPGVPHTREKLKEDFTTIAQLKELWNKLPKEWRGEQKAPSGNMLVKNAQLRIIKLITTKSPGY
jgi:hypothetical protein